MKWNNRIWSSDNEEELHKKELKDLVARCTIVLSDNPNDIVDRYKVLLDNYSKSVSLESAFFSSFYEYITAIIESNQSLEHLFIVIHSYNVNTISNKKSSDNILFFPLNKKKQIELIEQQPTLDILQKWWIISQMSSALLLIERKLWITPSYYDKLSKYPVYSSNIKDILRNQN